MVPGYALAGLPGALATIALFGVLLVRSTVRLFEDEGIADATIRALLPFFAFGPPILFYAVRIWPEVPAAFCFVEALRGVRQRRAQRWIPALLALGPAEAAVRTDRVVLLVPCVAWRRAHERAVDRAASILRAASRSSSGHLGSATNVHSWRELLPVAPLPYLHRPLRPAPRRRGRHRVSGAVLSPRHLRPDALALDAATASASA